MGEIICVIMIILLIIIIGFVFIFQNEKDATITKQDELNELDAIALSQLISNLPEIIHAPSSVKKQSCFDTSKLYAFQDILNDNPDISMEYYFDKLGNVNITIEQIYPVDDAKIWHIYVNNFDVPNQKTVSYGDLMKIPTSLYDPITDTYAFGMLYVTKYKKVD